MSPKLCLNIGSVFSNIISKYKKAHDIKILKLPQLGNSLFRPDHINRRSWGENQNKVLKPHHEDKYSHQK